MERGARLRCKAFCSRWAEGKKVPAEVAVMTTKEKKGEELHKSSSVEPLGLTEAIYMVG